MAMVATQGGGGGGGEPPDRAMSGFKIQEYFKNQRDRAQRSKLEKDSHYREEVARQGMDQMDATEYYRFMRGIYRPTRVGGMRPRTFENNFGTLANPKEPNLGRISEALRQRRRYELATTNFDSFGLTNEQQDVFRVPQGGRFADTGLRGALIQSSVQRGSGLRRVFEPDFQKAIQESFRFRDQVFVSPEMTANQQLAFGGGLSPRLGSDSPVFMLDNDLLSTLGGLIHRRNQISARRTRDTRNALIEDTKERSKEREDQN